MKCVVEIDFQSARKFHRVEECSVPDADTGGAALDASVSTAENAESFAVGDKDTDGDADGDAGGDTGVDTGVGSGDTDFGKARNPAESTASSPSAAS